MMQEKKDKDYYEEGFGDSMTEGESKSLQDDTSTLADAAHWRIEPKKKKKQEDETPSETRTEGQETPAGSEGVSEEGKTEAEAVSEEGGLAEATLPPAPASKGSPFFGLLAILSIILGGFTAYILWTIAGAGQVPPFISSIASAIVK